MRQHCMISFDSEAWEQIRQALGLFGQLKCKYCGVIITKENVGGVSNPKQVFCKEICCLAQHVVEYDANQKGDEK